MTNNNNENNKNSNLERFIRDNRESFDNLEPSGEVWNKIGTAIGQPQKTTRVISMSRAGWAVAATLFLAFAGILGYQMFSRPTEAPSVTLGEKKTEVPANSDSLVNRIDPQYGKLVSQFSTVIEAKQTELRKLEKDDPELYKKFSGDIQKLDSAYHSLRNTLNANPNTEQLLQAMISNLQLQIDLLNQQLTIIQKVKQPTSRPKSEKI
jgi:predicted negative regulator of RcsB-dependent stress response